MSSLSKSERAAALIASRHASRLEHPEEADVLDDVIDVNVEIGRITGSTSTVMPALRVSNARHNPERRSWLTGMRSIVKSLTLAVLVGYRFRSPATGQGLRDGTSDT